MRLKLALLASGTGSNAQAIIEACQNGVINADVKLVFTNKSTAKVIEKAQALHIPYESLNYKNFNSREEYDKAMLEILEKYEVDTIAMAGYMRIVTKQVIEKYKGRIFNIHPALLPSFAGADGIGDAKNWGVKIFGCTVHFVDEIMDNGPIIIQAALPSSCFEDTENKQLHTLEHKIYIQALKWFAEERIHILPQSRIVEILPKKDTSLQKACSNTLVYPPLEEW